MTIPATALLFSRSFLLCQNCPVQRDSIAFIYLPKTIKKIPLDYQPLNANAYFLPCNCMFLKCICNALAYEKVFQMSSFSKFTVPFMQLHDFLMQLQCKCIAQKCNCNANAFFGQRKENFPPHPLYKEKKKIKKRKLKKERFLHQEAGEPGAVTKPNGPGPRARCILQNMQNGDHFIGVNKMVL